MVWASATTRKTFVASDTILRVIVCHARHHVSSAVSAVVDLKLYLLSLKMIMAFTRSSTRAPVFTEQLHFLQEDPSAIIDNARAPYHASATLALEGMHSYDRRTLPAAFKTFRKVLPREDSSEKLTSFVPLLCSVGPLRKETASSALRDLCRHAVLDLLPVAVECALDRPHGCCF